MRAISEMYKRSGGTNHQYLCAECDNLIKECKRFYCSLYREAGGTRQWQPQWIACKFFDFPYLPKGKAERQQEAEELSGTWEQMDIFAFPQYLPEGKE